MEVKTLITNGVKTITGLGVLLSFFYTMLQLTLFLSKPILKKNLSQTDQLTDVSWNLLSNMSLLVLFILVHSLLAIPSIKDSVKKRLSSFYRAFYITCTLISLQILIQNWASTPQVTLWKYNIDFSPFWWLYVAGHTITWLFIYVGTICMDINELIGIKQLYYSIASLPDPISQKSADLQRLNLHMRHPSFLGFLIILWTFPIMTLDRFLLSSILTIYMYISWNTDDKDFQYQNIQYRRKFLELESLRN